MKALIRAVLPLLLIAAAGGASAQEIRYSWLDMSFMAAGKLSLQNIDFDGHAYLGFFNAETNPDARMLSSFFARQTFTFMSPGRRFSPTTWPS